MTAVAMKIATAKTKNKQNPSTFFYNCTQFFPFASPHLCTLKKRKRRVLSETYPIERPCNSDLLSIKYKGSTSPCSSTQKRIFGIHKSNYRKILISKISWGSRVEKCQIHYLFNSYSDCNPLHACFCYLMVKPQLFIPYGRV